LRSDILAVIESLNLELTPRRIMMLAAYVTATVLLIPAEQLVFGFLSLAACIFFVATDEELKVRRRMGILIGCVVILGLCDINTSLSNENFLKVGIPFTLVIGGPFLVAQFTDRDVIRYRFWPKVWRKHDVIYTIISIPLAWLILKGYTWGNQALFDDELLRHWTMPEEPDQNAIKRLFIGINLVGIWDELFFVNTVYALLRSLFSYRIANAMQAVLYTAVLFDMAFTGLGVFIVFYFAWTQGHMFEKSESLLWVLIVHLIVDYILVAMIVQNYYPDYGFDYLWRKGF
jgi:hypothetical protein